MYGVVLGVVFGLVPAGQLILGSHRSPWFWLFLMAACFAVVGGQVAWRSLSERDAVRDERDERSWERDEARRLRDEAFSELDGARARAYDHHPEAFIRGARVHLADLVRDQMAPTISGKTFTDCDVVGPAVVFFKGGILNGCEWYADLDALIYPQPERQQLVGVIALEGCSFFQCRFVAIAVMANEEQGEAIRHGMSPAP
jgi:hypothetical protein